MSKIVRDGKVAVLVSRGFGAGWYSWNASRGYKDCLYDPGLVALVEAAATEHEICAYAEAKWPDGYWGGAATLEIEWVPQGAAFELQEYDGAESIRLRDAEDWLIA